MHIQQNKTDPLVFGHIGIGSYQCKHPVSVLGAGGPDFLAVDDKMISFKHCSGLQTGKVRPCPWFTIALTPGNFAANDFRDMPLFLLFSYFEPAPTNIKTAAVSAL